MQTYLMSAVIFLKNAVKPSSFFIQMSLRPMRLSLSRASSLSRATMVPDSVCPSSLFVTATYLKTATSISSWVRVEVRLIDWLRRMI